MRGVNFGGWFSQVDAIQEKDPEGFIDLPTHVSTFLGQQDFARVASWGFDHVRLPVDYDNVFMGPELRPVEPILDALDEALDRLTALGLDVILDLHRCPGHDFLSGCSTAQELFTASTRREEVQQVWKYLAERYGTRPRLLLELLNEPVADDARQWDDLKDDLVAYVRRYAPKSTIVVGSNRWSAATEFARLTPVRDDNVLYSFHFYEPLLFTHQRAPWLEGDVFQEARVYPGEYSIPPGTCHRIPLETGRWDKTRLRQQIEEVLRFREQHRVRVACNEFGVYAGGADRASQLRWMRDFVSTLDEQGIGFSYWNYKNLDFGLVSRGEQGFASYPQYDNPERIDHELVEILRRPRRRAVCRSTTAG
jgi:endoglucanase